MKAEILTIGDEILIGQITNTNSVWIAQQLNLSGIKVVHMSTVSDDASDILNAMAAAEKRADFVFITGGLGPTKDDVTKKTFAEFFKAELVIDEVVLNDVDRFFSKRGRELTEINRKQALVPTGCFVIRNSNGTAPGMWMKKNNTVFISMPGVPYEMKAMVSEVVIPKIVAENKLPEIYHKTVLTQGIGESALAELIEKWEDELVHKNIKLAYLPQPGMVRLRLSTFGNDPLILKNTIDAEIESLKSIVSQYIFGYEEYGQEPPTIERIVSELLKERKQTLSVAESCTGGYISSLFTALPGASVVFKGGMVPYANITKNTLLNVDAGLFETVGAVSRECVEQLARNVIGKFNSDYSISVSGIAGPTGGTEEKPVGTVWVAVASKEKVLAMKFRFGENRQRNIVMTANAAMSLLRKFILKDKSLF